MSAADRFLKSIKAKKNQNKKAAIKGSKPVTIELLFVTSAIFTI